MSTKIVRLRDFASSTQRAFYLSKSLECALFGPRGEGKTDAGIMRMCNHAANQPESSRPIPWAIIRDTWTNLERTTLRSFLQPHPDSYTAQIRPYLKISNGGQHIEFPGFWQADLFGMDSLGDLDRLQSLQLGGIWVEEPAPAASEDIGGGLDERVVTVGITSLRHHCDWRTLQLTSNYPDEDHWAWRRYGMERLPGRRLFRIPRGENVHLPSDYRENMAQALAGDSGLLQRLVLGQPGFVVQGEAVSPEYDAELHKSNIDFDPYPRLMGYRFWDGGLNPTCIMGQVTPRGYFQVFPESFVGDGIGMEQLIEEQVKPLCDTKYACIPQWCDVGDPALETREQSSSARSAALVIKQLLKTDFIPGPVDWESRRIAVKKALLHRIDGLPFLQISMNEKYLTRALRGGWHYHKTPAGLIVNDKPVKDKHSHPGDAFAYGICVVLGNLRARLIDLDKRRRQDKSSWAKSKLKSRYAAC